MKRLVAVAALMALFVSVSCKKSSDTPAGPTPPGGNTNPGTGKVLTVTGDLGFGLVSIGAIASRQITFTAGGSESVSVSNIAAPVGFGVDSSSAFLSAGESRTFTVFFAPALLQAYTGALTFTSNKTTGPSSVSLSGQATVPAGARLLSGQISGGDSPCVFSFVPSGACQVFPVTFTTSGRVDAVLNWNGDDALLALYLIDAKNNETIVRGSLSFDPYPLDGEHSTLSTNISPGEYKFYVNVISISKITDFTVVTSHPD